MTDDNNLMRHLFDQATDTGPATAALDRLIYCHLLDPITGGNLAVAVDQLAKPGSVEAAAVELEQLDDNERNALAETVVPNGTKHSLAPSWPWSAPAGDSATTRTAWARSPRPARVRAAVR